MRRAPLEDEVNRLSRRQMLKGAVSLLALGGGAGAGTWLLRSPRDAALVAHEVIALGTRVRLIVRVPDRRRARAVLDSAARQVFGVHQMCTLFEPSPLLHLNERASTRPIRPPQPLFRLIASARELTRETGGLFDPTLGRLIAALRQRQGRPWAGAASSAKAGTELEQSTGWDKVQLEGDSIRLTHPLTAIDLNAIAKGFAIDMAARELEHRGIRHFLINAGGDIYAAGRPSASSRGWEVRLPLRLAGRQEFEPFFLSDEAIATSGNYHQPRRPEGGHLAHILHRDSSFDRPDWQSATAIAATAARADAWATSAFLGHEAKLRALVGKEKQVRLFLVDRAGLLTKV